MTIRLAPGSISTQRSPHERTFDSRDRRKLGCGAGREILEMRRRSFLLGVVGLAAASVRSLAAARRGVETLVPGALTIGTYFVNPPFEYVADGKRVGFEVDLMEAIANRIGLRPVFVDTRWEVILGQQEAGRYDCIVGGITITPSREKRLSWSVPYMMTTLSLVVNAVRTPGIRDLADLAKASVAVQAATTDYDAAVVLRHEGQIGSVVVYPFDRIADAMRDLAAGRVTAVMKVAPVAAWLARQTPGLRVIAQVPDDPQPLGIGFRKGNAQLRGAVDEALGSLRADGTLAALAHKWGVP